MAQLQKKFSFSWSRLKNFRACPKRHYHVDLIHDFEEEKGEALLRGNAVHKALADRIEHGQPLPRSMQGYEHWPVSLEALGGNGIQIKVENKLAITKDFQATGFFEEDTWFRAVIDAIVLAPPYRYSTVDVPPEPIAVTLDWKTGAMKPEIEQLGLSAQVVFAHYPTVNFVVSSYIWLGDGKETQVTYHRDAMTGLWNRLWPEIRVMEDAFRTTTYPPKPGPFCKRYCPVTSCPYHGKGSY